MSNRQTEDLKSSVKALLMSLSGGEEPMTGEKEIPSGAWPTYTLKDGFKVTLILSFTGYPEWVEVSTVKAGDITVPTGSVENHTLSRINRLAIVGLYTEHRMTLSSSKR